jgi:flagellar protein FliJ
MKPDPTITLLIERAREEYERSTRALGQATTACDRQQQKLQMLENYRNEYRQRMEQQAAGGGMAMTELVNFRRFIAQLDQAVEQQQRNVRLADQGAEFARKQWQQAHRQLKSYEVLLARREAAAEVVANRREQRESDAYAQRIAQTRKSPF